MSDPTIAQSDDAGSVLKSCRTNAELDVAIATLTAEALKGEKDMGYKALRRAKRAASEGVPTPDTSAKLALAQHRYDAVCAALGESPAPVNVTPGSRAPAGPRTNSPVVKGSLNPLDFLNRAFTAAAASPFWSEDVRDSFAEAVLATTPYAPDAATLARILAYDAGMSLPEGPARDAIMAVLGDDPRARLAPPTWGTLPQPAPVAAAPETVDPKVADVVAAEAERIAKELAEQEAVKAAELDAAKEAAVVALEQRQKEVSVKSK